MEQKMQLRPQQKEAVAQIQASFKAGNNFTLAVGCCGVGKTIIAASLIEWAIANHDIKILVMAHQQELIKQAMEKLLVVAPHLEPLIGIYCASLNKDKQQGQITIASVQSLSNELNLDAYNLVIIDEVHLLPDSSKKSQYATILKNLLLKNSRLRVLGVTATPYRLDEGLIYGKKNSWFSSVAWSVTLDEMIDEGYLCPYRYKVADGSGAREAANKTDFTMDALSVEMRKEVHLGSVKKAIEEHAEGRLKILVFAVNIEHAEALAGVLGCRAVHSKEDRESAMDSFVNGDDRILVNVDILTTGFDFPGVDCILMARPTLSPALYVQICGRGLRLAEGKKDCMILDLVGNYVRHGDLSDPHIKEPDDEEEGKERKERELESNICPECFELVEAGLMECQECGADMAHREEVNELNAREEMKEIEMNKNKGVIDWIEVDKNYRTKKGAVGNMCIAVLTSGKRVHHFFSNSYKATIKRVRKFEELKPGQKVKIEVTQYGEKLRGFIK
jgi:DNA repair protein RadD